MVSILGDFSLAYFLNNKQLTIVIIDFINTGGTINSAASNNSLAVKPLATEAAAQTIDDTPIASTLNRLAQQLHLDLHVHTPWQKNSEDVDLGDWQQLLHCLQDCNESESEAILISHGTDSMTYSLALATCFDDFWRKPVCFTGAFISPDLPSSDAELNLHAALAYLKQQALLKQNALHACQLAFQSPDNNAEIMPGSWVLPLRSYDRYFQTAYQQSTARFLAASLTLESNRQDVKPYPKVQDSTVPKLEHMQYANSRIQYCLYYPGMCLNTLQQSTQAIDILIIEVFHSGTASFSGASSLMHFIEQFQGLVILASLPSAYITKPYASSLALIEAGACLIQDIPSHYLYIYTLLRLAQTPQLTSQELKHSLLPWLFVVD